MVKLVVAYGPPEDPAAFDQHYNDTHAPLAQAVPGLRNFEAGRVIATPDGSDAPYYLIAQLSFDDVPALQAAMGTAEGQAASGDIANFATGGATLMIVES
jgi:uncharacterized protein (TIGR02118 family)